jgi:hypothetical protein
MMRERTMREGTVREGTTREGTRKQYVKKKRNIGVWMRTSGSISDAQEGRQ